MNKNTNIVSNVVFLLSNELAFALIVVYFFAPLMFIGISSTVFPNFYT